MAPPASRVPIEDLGFAPRDAVGRIESFFEKESGDWISTHSTGFLGVFRRDLASPRDFTEKLYLATTAHSVVDHRVGKFQFLLFFPGQKTLEDKSPDRREGCFEVALDELSPNRKIFVSRLYNSVGLLDQEAAFDVAFIELTRLHSNSGKSLTDLKKQALEIELDQELVVGKMVRWFGYPVAEEQDRRADESIMFRHKSPLKEQRPPQDGVPGALSREGLGRPGDGGSGGPWLFGRKPIGLMAWQLLEDLHEEEPAESYSPSFSSVLVDSVLQTTSLTKIDPFTKFKIETRRKGLKISGNKF
jgi:hypothetical protein